VSWINENDVLLRSETVAQEFNGFQLRSVSGNAVLGFTRDSSLLEVAVDTDTLTLGFNELVTSIQRNALPAPSEVLMLQDGVDVASVAVDLRLDDLLEANVHNDIFRVNSEALPLSEPADFKRPALSALDLIAITRNDERLLLASADIDENGVFSFSSSDLVLAVQNTARGIGEFDRFQLAAPVGESTLDSIYLKRIGDDDAPRLILTITEVR